MSVVIRDWRPEDEDALRRLHAKQGIDYAYEALDHPLFFIRKVLEVDGEVRAALVLKLCAETRLLLDVEQDPRDKMGAMQELQAAVLNEAYARGLDEVHAAVPAIGFEKRLGQLGWAKDRDGFELWSRGTRCDQQ